MKTPAILCLALSAAALLSSCSLYDTYGTSTPELKPISEERTTFAGREFITRRFMVNGNTNETFVETMEVRGQGPREYLPPVGYPTVINAVSYR